MDVWQICNLHERPASFGGIMSISSVSALKLVRELGGNETDWRKVLYIDRIALPKIRESLKEKE
jgi:hypothetical protein